MKNQCLVGTVQNYMIIKKTTGVLMFSFNLYDNNIDNDLIKRILEKYKESNNKLNRKINI